MKNAYNLTAQGYFSSPLGLELDFAVVDRDTLLACESLLLCRSSSPWVKFRRIKDVKRALVKSGFFKDFKLRLLWRLKSLAYIEDFGRLTLSIGVLRSRTSPVVLSVLCHELGHMWLSQQDFYPTLKEVNRQFKERCADVGYCELLSPIELYAMDLSVKIMESVLSFAKDTEQKNRLFELIEQEKEKINLVKKEILKINENIIWRL